MKRLFSLLTLSLVAFSCLSESTTSPENQIKTSSYPIEYEQVSLKADGDPIFMGGYGSSMAYCAVDSTFYLLTDRGPNVNGPTDESKYFLFEDFSPNIGKFKLVDGKMQLIEKIILCDEDGLPFVGLPNRKGDGVTGEVAYDYDGNIVLTDRIGLDTEGLALSPDGTFWVSDEYAPYIIHFDASGRAIRKLTPSNGLPSHFAERRPNRGMEGLTLSSDGTKLYGIMQSPLYLPDNSTKNFSRNIRILELEIETGLTREFIYQLESPLLAVSEITFVNDSTLLVLERDGKFPTPENNSQKHLYQINIAQATDVSNMIIELKDDLWLSENGVKPVTKSLKVDLVKAIPDYSHDKIEGVAIISESKIAIVNDDDFGVDQAEGSTYKSKLNAKGEIDHGEIHILEF